MTHEVRDETGGEPNRSATERAEELVDRAARGASYVAALVGLRLLRSASLVREEAEDIWAEAQSLRHREGQEAEPTVYGGDVEETIKATEAARRKAEELALDLSEIQGTGAGGQITVEDVKNKAKAERS